MFTPIRREFAYVTPEMAEHFLKFNEYDAQRNARPAHVTELATKMEKGLFRFGEVALATYQGTTYMMNGQHVCTAIIKSGLSQACVVEEFHAETLRDLSLLFQQFEILPRSVNDMIKAEKNALKLDWPTQVANFVVATATILEFNSPKFNHASGIGTKSTRYMTKEQKVAVLKDYIEEGKFIKSIVFDEVSSTDTKHIKRAAVGAMMIKTWNKSKEDANRFWRQVRDGEILTKKDPAWVLREFLISHKTISHREHHVYRRATNHEIAYRSALAWNAFREGRNISKTSYFPERPIPQIK